MFLSKKFFLNNNNFILGRNMVNGFGFPFCQTRRDCENTPNIRPK